MQPNPDLEMLLADWRAAQAVAAEGALRFVVETPAVDHSALEKVVGDALRLKVEAGPLFRSDDSALGRFRLLLVPGVPRSDRADLFEVAGAIRALTGAITVEPDVGSPYFECEVRPPAAAAPESADWAFWCWADSEIDAPDDPDWALRATRVREAWTLCRTRGRPDGGDGIVVFQPDTGVVQHVELPDTLATDPRAANLIEGGAGATDRMNGVARGHGTGTASVVASSVAGRMAGAAPNATLVPVRCLNDVAVFDQSLVAQAIDYAVEHGAHIITMSLGGVPSRALHAAVQKAVARNVIVLAAAGNCVREVVWPARYGETIAVGGTNEARMPWRGSCFGPAVAFSAPAEFVQRAVATQPEGDMSVGGGQGTSFAVALTAGIAALWLAFHGRDALVAVLPRSRTLQWLFRTMVAASASAPTEFDRRRYGAGIIDAQALLEANVATHIAATGGLAEAAGLAGEGVADLLVHAFGRSGLEAAAPALIDPQHEVELACAALDRLRAGPTVRAHVESMPPPLLSPSLRSALGSGVVVLG